MTGLPHDVLIFYHSLSFIHIEICQIKNALRRRVIKNVNMVIEGICNTDIVTKWCIVLI